MTLKQYLESWEAAKGCSHSHMCGSTAEVREKSSLGNEAKTLHHTPRTHPELQEAGGEGTPSPAFS